MKRCACRFGIQIHPENQKELELLKTTFGLKDNFEHLVIKHAKKTTVSFEPLRPYGLPKPVADSSTNQPSQKV